MKKRIAILTFTIIIAILWCFIASSLRYNEKDKNVLILQLGKVVDVKKTPGIYLTIPFIQTSKTIFVGENLYDIPTTTVTTSDKKSMIANCYVTWKIIDSKKYYQTLSSEATAQSRIDTAVYAALKNIISSTKQSDMVSNKDGKLGSNILKKVTSLTEYGIAVTQIETKVLDLPDDNKNSVYTRMISERNSIAAKYKANGERDAANITNNTDAKVRKTVSDAKATAADVIANGESQYFQILADSYSKSADRKQFYNYMISLDSLKESLKNGGKIVIDKDSPIYNILINNSSK